MDPFELLKKDHEKVSELFKRIEASSGKAKIEIFGQLKDELEVHTAIEEMIFYPALEKANETRDLTLEAYEEHKVVKDLLAELAVANKPSDEWDAKLKVLKENVEHHVDEEENELFDKASDVLTGDEAERLGDRMQAEKVKRGASAPASDPPIEEPGFLQSIANVLGLGGSKKADKKKSSGTTRTGSKAVTSSKASKSKAAKRSTTKTSKPLVKKASAKKSAQAKAAKKASVTSKPRKGSKAGTKRAGRNSSARKDAAVSSARKSAARKKGAAKKQPSGKTMARKR